MIFSYSTTNSEILFTEKNQLADFSIKYYCTNQWNVRRRTKMCFHWRIVKYLLIFSEIFSLLKSDIFIDSVWKSKRKKFSLLSFIFLWPRWSHLFLFFITSSYSIVNFFAFNPGIKILSKQSLLLQTRWEVNFEAVCVFL